MSRKHLAGVETKRCACWWCGGCCACSSEGSFPHIKNGKKHQKLLRSGGRERNIPGRVGIRSQALAADVWFHRKIFISSLILGSEKSRINVIPILCGEPQS